MNLRPGDTNVQPLWLVVRCPSIEPAAPAGIRLSQRTYFTGVVRKASLLSATAVYWAAMAQGCSYWLRRFGPAPGLSALAFVPLPGCASHQPPPVVLRDDGLIHVHLVDNIVYKPGTEAFGLSRCANGLCVLHVLCER